MAQEQIEKEMVDSCNTQIQQDDYLDDNVIQISLREYLKLRDGFKASETAFKDLIDYLYVKGLKASYDDETDKKTDVVFDKYYLSDATLLKFLKTVDAKKFEEVKTSKILSED